MTDEPTTYVRPEYTKVSGRHTADGVLFISYSVGVLRYARVSEDGQIEIWPRRCHYNVRVIDRKSTRLNSSHH